jgi:hypothetical protein
VGCDLKRKLGSEDRLAGAIHKAFEINLPYDKILFALVCGCYFRASDEEGKMLMDDMDFMNRYSNEIDSVLTSVCGFDRIKHKKIIEEAYAIDEMIHKAGLIASIQLKNL